MKEDSDPNIDPEYASIAYHNYPEELHLACSLHSPQANTTTSASNENTVNIASSSTFNSAHVDYENHQASVQEEFRENTMSFYTSMEPQTYGSHQANYSLPVPTNAHNSNTYDGLPNFITEPHVSYFKLSDQDHNNSDLYTNIYEYSSNLTLLYVAGAHQPSYEDNQQLLPGTQMLYKSNHELSNIQVDQQVLQQSSATGFAGPSVSTSGYDTSYQSSFNDVISLPSYSSQTAPNWEWNKYKAHQNMFSLGPPLEQNGNQLYSYVNREEFLPQSSLHISHKSESIQNYKYKDSDVLNLQESICMEAAQCSPKYSTQLRIQRRAHSHTGEELFQCDICKELFSTSYSLKIHIRTHTGQNLYKYDFCPRKYLYKSALETHGRIYTGERPYQCELCPKKFSLSGHLKIHRRTHTGEKPYQCDLCPLKFSDRSYFIRHRRTHTGEKLFQCDICKELYSTSYTLKIHKRIHTGEKPYQCNLCPFKFSDPSHFIRHRRTHTGERPYQCDLCPSNFSNRSHFVRYRQTYTGEKPYQCDICSKKFTSSYQLAIHRWTHIGEKPSM